MQSSPEITGKARSIITLASHQLLTMRGHFGEEFDVINGITVVGRRYSLSTKSVHTDPGNNPCVIELYGNRPTPPRMDLTEPIFTARGQRRALVTHGPFLSVNYQGETAQAAALIEIPEEALSEMDLSTFTMVFPLGSTLSRFSSVTTQSIIEIMNMDSPESMAFFRQRALPITDRNLTLINSSLDHLENSLAPH